MESSQSIESLEYSSRFVSSLASPYIHYGVSETQVSGAIGPVHLDRKSPSLSDSQDLTRCGLG